MSTLSSPDGVVSVTAAVVQGPDGVYVLQVTDIMPEATPIAIEISGERVYEGTDTAPE
jgi:hypothetical protein